MEGGRGVRGREVGRKKGGREGVRGREGGEKGREEGRQNGEEGRVRVKKNEEGAEIEPQKGWRGRRKGGGETEMALSKNGKNERALTTAVQELMRKACTLRIH